MKKLKKIIATILVTAVGFSAVGCGSSSSSDSSSSSKGSSGELTTVRIGVPAAEATLTENAALADSLGYITEELEKAGYKPEYVGFAQGGTAINEAFAFKEVDYAFMGDVPNVVAASNGLEIELIASLNSSMTMAIIAGNASGITSTADLAGKKVVIGFGTITHVYLSKALNDVGLTTGDVDVINDLANGATLLATGDADAAVVTATGAYLYESMGVGSVFIDSADKPENSAQYFVSGRKAFIESEPESAKALIKAFIRSKDYAVENPDEAYEALSSENFSKEIIEKSYSAGFESFDPAIGSDSVKKLKELSAFLAENQVISKEADIDSLVNTKYYEEAAAELK